MNCAGYQNKLYFGGHVNRAKGFTLIELMIVVAIIGILALIAIPNFVNLRMKAFDASAQSAARISRFAQEIYYNTRADASQGWYTTDLSDLLVQDRNLTDDPGVTFVLLEGNTSGFTLYTEHAHGSGRQFTARD